MTTVQIIRLSTGEELIAEVKDMAGGYGLTDVAILIPTEANSLGLAPFMAYSTVGEDGLVLREKDVMFITKPVPPLEDQYKSMFSKIITPDSKIHLAS